MRRAFTLVELVIVMSILVIIALLGVNAFSISRQNIQIELATEETLSSLHKARNEIQKTSQCALIKFKKGSDAQIAYVPFDSITKTCTADKPVYKMLAALNNVEVGSITVASLPKNELVITVMPPHGEMRFDAVGELAEVKFELSTNPNYFRQIKIDSSTGRIEG